MKFYITSYTTGDGSDQDGNVMRSFIARKNISDAEESM